MTGRNPWPPPGWVNVECIHGISMQKHCDACLGTAAQAPPAAAPDREAAEQIAKDILAYKTHDDYWPNYSQMNDLARAYQAECAASEALRRSIDKLCDANSRLTDGRDRAVDEVNIQTQRAEEAERKLAGARADEREACAKIADEWAKPPGGNGRYTALAAEIRARG